MAITGVAHSGLGWRPKGNRDMINNPEVFERMVWLLSIGGANETPEIPRSARMQWNDIGPVVPLDLDDGTEDDYRYSFFSDATPRDVGGRVDVSFACWAVDEHPRGEEIRIVRARSVGPKQVRGKVHRLRPFMIEACDAHLLIKNGTWSGARGVYGGAWDAHLKNNGFEIIDGDKMHHRSESSDGGYARVVTNNAVSSIPAIAVSMEWTKRLWWHADIALGKAPGVRVPVVAEALAELFDTRARHSASGRLKALVHWVRGHRRKSRNSEDMTHFVRSHLRGALEFEWNDMTVRIQPAWDELSKLHKQGLAMKVPCPL